MDDTTRRVLKRVVAQYRTGIRKPFGVDGHLYYLAYDGGHDFLVFDTPGKRHHFVIHEVSIDGVWLAIQQATIHQVHET